MRGLPAWLVIIPVGLGLFGCGDDSGGTESTFPKNATSSTPAVDGSVAIDGHELAVVAFHASRRVVQFDFGSEGSLKIFPYDGHPCADEPLVNLVRGGVRYRDTGRASCGLSVDVATDELSRGSFDGLLVPVTAGQGESVHARVEWNSDAAPAHAVDPNGPSQNGPTSGGQDDSTPPAQTVGDAPSQGGATGEVEPPRFYED